MLNTNDFITQADLPHRRIEAWKFSAIKPWLDTQTYESGSSIESILTQKLQTLGSVNKLKDLSSLSKTFDFAHTDSVKEFAQKTPSTILEVTVPANEQKELSLDIELSEKSSFQNTILVFRIEKGANLNYIANIQAASESFHLVQHYFILEANSRVSFGRVQNQDHTSAHLGYDHAITHRDAHFEFCALNLGSKISRSNIDVSIKEEGAHATVNGIYITNEERQADTYSHIHHHAAHTTSTQLYKGILSDESKGIFTGRIHVHKDSQLINSEQLNRVLLLSPKAHSHSQPQLEIFADDVKCSHGSTTGQLSPEEVFYLQTRGIDAKKSSEMIARGFAYDVLFKLESQWLTDKLMPYLKDVVNS